MKTKIRAYIERNHYPKKRGGGSFYQWFDIIRGDNKIEVRQLHAIGRGKMRPRDGSGSAFTLTIKEAEILITTLQKVLK